MSSSRPAGGTDHPQRNGAEVPAAVTFGVGATTPLADGVEVTVVRRPEAVDGAGALPTGVLALAVDHALGGAIGQVIADDEVMITSHMHLELIQPITPDLDAVVAHGRVVHKGGGHAFTQGEIRAEDGRLLALISARFAMLPLDASAGGYVRSEGAVAPAAPTRRGGINGDGDVPPVLGLLQLHLVGTTPNRVEGRFRAHAGLANERQGVHGGVGVLIGERSLDHLVTSVGGGGFRPVELRAVFLRPIAADGSELTCEAEVGYAGRSVITSRATVHTPGGKAAVVVDAIHAVGRG